MNMILRALMVSVWFMALTFPLVVLKVDALNDTILFRWENMASIGVGAFVLSIFWRWSMERKARGAVSTGPSLFARALEAVRQPKPRYTCLGLIAVLMLVMPYISSMYQINIMISALIYIMLGLGLNIVVGLAGQLGGAPARGRHIAPDRAQGLVDVVGVAVFVGHRRGLPDLQPVPQVTRPHCHPRPPPLHTGTAA